DQAAVLDVAGELDRERPPRAADAEVGVVLGALLEDYRHRRQREHVVDDCRLAEEALDGRQRRLVPNQAALAFEALEQRGLFAADVGAGAEADIDVEGLAAADD